MSVIGKRSNSGTLCISLTKAMRGDGFVAGARAVWYKKNGEWVLVLEQQPAPAPAAEKPVEEKPVAAAPSPPAETKAEETPTAQAAPEPVIIDLTEVKE